MSFWRRLQCALGRHDWEQHPAFEGFRARRCTRCPRVEADVFWSGWKHRPHLDGVSVEELGVGSTSRVAPRRGGQSADSSPAAEPPSVERSIEG
jgi:hypothetical protein